MKIVVSYKKDGTIWNVYSFDYYIDKGKSIEEIEAAIKETNDATGYGQFKSFEFSDEIGEVITMLLGEKKYKRYKSINDVYDKLEEVNDLISGVQSDIFDAAEDLERMKDLVEKLTIYQNPSKE